MLPDHYQALGVDPRADSAAVRAAYLRLMRAHHPDVRPGDRAAGETARRANAAWAVLGDPAARASYDRLRAARTGGPAGPGAVRVPHAAVTRVAYAPAYSPEGRHYRRAFHHACLRIGGAVFAVGLVLLSLAAL